MIGIVHTTKEQVCIGLVLVLIYGLKIVQFLFMEYIHVGLYILTLFPGFSFSYYVCWNMTNKLQKNGEKKNDYMHACLKKKISFAKLGDYSLFTTSNSHSFQFFSVWYHKIKSRACARGYTSINKYTLISIDNWIIILYMQKLGTMICAPVDLLSNVTLQADSTSPCACLWQFRKKPYLRSLPLFSGFVHI